jgi:peptide-methionine (S)-S-oxide reductase
LGSAVSGGAERKFWELGAGVYSTAVGYAGGYTPNPTYEEVCSGRTGHTEVALVVFEAKRISYDRLLKTFWESHNPTHGMRQGHDVGTQHRSAVCTFNDAQHKAAVASRAACQKALAAKGLGAITTEIAPAGEFYFAEDCHQQYLTKNPAGYCGLCGTGVSCPIGTGVSARSPSDFIDGQSFAGRPLKRFINHKRAKPALSRCEGWLRCGLCARFDCR